jgi:acetyl-CoA acetyltransferase
MSTVNVNGGAIAIGHPLGCSGARLMATLVHELERTGGRWGLQTMCEGGGMANATVLERLG